MRCTPGSCVSACRGGRVCTLRSCFSACRGGRGCTSRSRVSPSREGTGCTPRSCFSACCGVRGCIPRTPLSASRADRGCTLRSSFSACREGRGCTARSCFSPSRADKGCTARSCTSPCRAGRGCTPRTGLSFSRAGIALYSSFVPDQPRAPRCAVVPANSDVASKFWEKSSVVACPSPRSSNFHFNDTDCAPPSSRCFRGVHVTKKHPDGFSSADSRLVRDPGCRGRPLNVTPRTPEPTFPTEFPRTYSSPRCSPSPPFDPWWCAPGARAAKPRPRFLAPTISSARAVWFASGPLFTTSPPPRLR